MRREITLGFSSVGVFRIWADKNGWRILSEEKIKRKDVFTYLTANGDIRKMVVTHTKYGPRMDIYGV
jgi:hypothetical protein